MLVTVLGIIIISVFGTLSHFIYEISNHNKFIGLFVSVNESVWEHIKIALTPTFLWGLIDGMIYGLNENYFFAKFISLVIIIILMPSLFYGYKKIIKKEYLFLDIIIFYLVVMCSQFSFYYLVNIDSVNFIFRYISCIGIFIIFGEYMIFTLMPIKNNIFKDPISKKYGFRGHTHHHEKCTKIDK